MVWEVGREARVARVLVSDVFASNHSGGSPPAASSDCRPHIGKPMCDEQWDSNTTQ